MRNKKYWNDRFINLQKAQLNKGIKYIDDLNKQFNIFQKNLEYEIDVWYTRLSRNNNVSLLEAKKLLRANEFEEFHWKLEEYIKKCKENKINKQWIKQLENASIKVHISQLEAIKLQIQQENELLYGNILDGLDETLKDIYTSGYYKTIYEIQKGFETRVNFSKLDTRRIEKVLSNPWTSDGKTFSDRIWSQKQKDINDLTTILMQSIIRNDASKETIKAIQKRFNVSRSQSKRLVFTETAFFSSAATKDSYNELGLEKYEILATLDNRTSQICQSLDGHVFNMKDYNVGITAPPFHPYCRTTTCPYFNDEFTKDKKRAARDESTGKTYYVDSDLTYPQWEAKYLNNNDNTKTEIKDFKFIKNLEPDLTLTKINNKIQKGTKEDYILKEIVKENGFDGLPTIVNKKEMDKLIAKGNIQIFRGIHDKSGHGVNNAKSYAENLKYGEYFAGTGMYGNGIYSSVNIKEAKLYSNNGVLLRMALNKKAKIFKTKNQVTALMSVLKVIKDMKVKDNVEQAVLENLGRAKAIQGYDAIYIEDKENYIILNRNMLFIEE